jgi:signal transduction histidine kinase
VPTRHCSLPWPARLLRQNPGELTRERLAERNIASETRIENDPVGVLSDAKRLEQVFWNLLSNGVRFGQEGGSSASSPVESGTVRRSRTPWYTWRVRDDPAQYC